jgi:hypothetical protein
MNNANELKSVNEQIAELHKKRQDLLALEDVKLVDRIKSMDWVKDHTYRLRLEISIYGGGAFEPVLFFYSKEFDHLSCHNMITLAGDSRYEHQNLNLNFKSFNRDCCSITTSRFDLMTYFIKKYKPTIEKDDTHKEIYELFKVVVEG